MTAQEFDHLAETVQISREVSIPKHTRDAIYRATRGHCGASNDFLDYLCKNSGGCSCDQNRNGAVFRRLLNPFGRLHE